MLRSRRKNFKFGHKNKSNCSQNGREKIAQRKQTQDSVQWACRGVYFYDMQWEIDVLVIASAAVAAIRQPNTHIYTYLKKKIRKV